MPPILRKRGRPKGHELTVIGLPAKKKAKSGKVQPFIKLHISLKKKRYSHVHLLAYNYGLVHEVLLHTLQSC